MLSALGGLSSDDESQLDVENVKPRRGRPKGSVNAVKALASKPRQAPTRKRKVLEEQVNVAEQPADDDLDNSLSSIGAMTMDDDLISVAPRVNITKKKQKITRSESKTRATSSILEDATPVAKPKPGRKRKAAPEPVIEEELMEEEEPPAEISTVIKAKLTRRRKAAEPEPEPEATVAPDADSEPEPEPEPKPPTRKASKPSTQEPHSKPLTTSSSLPIRSPTKPISHPLPNSISNPSTAESALLRRKLGTLTHQLSTLETKHAALRTIGIRDAESNSTALRAAAEEQLSAAARLVESLRAELLLHKPLAHEAVGLRGKLAAQSGEVQALKAELLAAKAEGKSLGAKLAAVRGAASSVRSTQGMIPGSAMKKGAAGPGLEMQTGQTVMVGSAEAAQAAAVAALKEELYSDLSGLAVLKVDRGRGGAGDVFDCIQTGNQTSEFARSTSHSWDPFPKSLSLKGQYADRWEIHLALHFKLTVEAPTSDENYQDGQYVYTPKIDEDRDRALIGLLPDYLTEEICFNRDNAANFYRTLTTALAKKP